MECWDGKDCSQNAVKGVAGVARVYTESISHASTALLKMSTHSVQWVLRQNLDKFCPCPCFVLSCFGVQIVTGTDPVAASAIF